jgi:hypothetical protein
MAVSYSVNELRLWEGTVFQRGQIDPFAQTTPGTTMVIDEIARVVSPEHGFHLSYREISQPELLADFERFVPFGAIIAWRP